VEQAVKELDRYKAYVALLETALKEFKPRHYHVEEDTWYCCPACPDYNGEDEKKCKCPFERHTRLFKNLKDHKETLIGEAVFDL
jgi:hypothetical protein